MPTASRPQPSSRLLSSLARLRAQGVPFRKLADLRRREGNPRDNAHAVPDIVRSLNEFGWTTPMIVDPRGELEAGDTRYLAALNLGLEEVPVVETDHDERLAKLYVPADNRLGEIATWNPFRLADLFSGFSPEEIRLTGWEPADVAKMLASANTGGDDSDETRRTLAERFGAPPFSILDARQGYWVARRRAWMAIGIRSEIGRPRNALGLSSGARDLKAYAEAKKSKGVLFASLSGQVPDYYDQKRAVDAMLGRATTNEEFEASYLRVADASGLSSTGTSVFDPVLTELLVRWFCPAGGRVIDPFAGGSVRGIVSAWLGRSYVGVDLRGEQVEANREQAESILPKAARAPRAPRPGHAALVTDPEAITPVEQVEHPDGGRIWLKRDDLFEVNGVSGAKARAGLALAKETGARGFVAAGSRHSPMVSRVARLAQALKIPCRVYTAKANDLSPAERDAVLHGADLIRPSGRGFLKRLIPMAEKDAAERGWEMVRLGLDADCYVPTNARQIENLPTEVKRIVCPVGSGMGLSSVLHGLDRIGRKDVAVLGVRVSDRPVDDLLDRRAPADWRERVKFVESGLPYETPARVTDVGGVRLDPMYEAKCLPHVQPGDLLWLFATASDYRENDEQPALGDATWYQGDSTAIRTVCAKETWKFDFLLTCPPYADLEVYSDDPRDLSTMPYHAFREAYERIIAETVSMLREDAFAAIVVGEVRGAERDGAYHGFVADTIRAFEKAGMAFYNEAIYLQALGSVPVRVARQFEKGRKFGKAHQNVLVFVRGSVANVIPRLEDPSASVGLATYEEERPVEGSEA